MKRVFLFIVSILLALCACSKEAAVPTCTLQSTEVQPTEAPTLPPPELTGDENSFGLSYLPDIGTYEPEKAPERWYPDYVGELIPSDEYGELIPYLGYIREFEEFSYGEWRVRKQAYYGLCTLDGVIVTDPVYSAVYMGADGYYILKGQPIEVELQYYTDYLYPFCIAKSDGSKVASLPSPAAVCGHFADDVYFTRTSYVDQSGWKIYSADGELLLEEKRYDDSVTIMPVAHQNGTITAYSDGTAYFVNSRFECTSAIFENIEYIGDDRYIVKEINGLYGIIDIDGRYLLQSEYTLLKRASFGFVGLKGDSVTVINDDLQTVSSFSVDYAVRDVYTEGPSVINVTGTEKVWDNHFYSLEGRQYEYDEVKLLHREGAYYCFAGKTSTLITDTELNEVVTFQRKGILPLYFANVASGYVALRDTETEGGDIMLYDVKEGDLIEGISDLHDDYYTVVAEDGTESYYDYNGDPIPKPEENVTHIDPWDSVETPYGEVRMRVDGDYAYTEDADGNIIVKRRAVFD